MDFTTLVVCLLVAWAACASGLLLSASLAIAFDVMGVRGVIRKLLTEQRVTQAGSVSEALPDTGR